MNQPAKTPMRVAHVYWPGATAEQRIIRARVAELVERRDAEWREIVARLEERLIDAGLSGN